MPENVSVKIFSGREVGGKRHNEKKQEAKLIRRLRGFEFVGESQECLLAAVLLL
jgi:ribosomal protein L35